MSNAELERLKRRLARGYQALSERARPLTSRLGARELRGELLGIDGLPIEGVEVLSRFGGRVLTSSEGIFSMRLWGQRASLTLRRGPLELTDWVQVELNPQGVTQLKVRWPRFVRGQLMGEGEQPLMGVSVSLNQSYQSFTDVYGAFSFPLIEGELEELDHFVFTIDGRRFVHHFQGKLRQPPLRLFYYERGELFYLRDLPSPLPLTLNVPKQHQHLMWATWFFYALVSLFVMSALWGSLPHLQGTSSAHERRPSAPFIAASSAPLEPPELPVHHNEKAPQESSTQGCESIEFTYREYRVPRGMEGFLLSLLFGSWQRWQGDLEALNNITADHQLQAGQFVKLKLPLYEWRLFTLYQDEGAAELREALGCDESGLSTCLKLLQVWNPHLNTAYLHKGDQLLVNPQLLRSAPWSELVLRRLEQLKRSRSRRQKRPRVRLPKGCVLLPLRPEVAARVEREERARLEALVAEREARRLEKEREREERRRQRQERRRQRKERSQRKGG